MLISQCLEAFRSCYTHWPHETPLLRDPFSHLFLKALVHHLLEVATHLTEVLVLELKHVDSMHGHVKPLITLLSILRDLICMLICLYIDLLVLLETLSNQSINVDVSSEGHHICLGCHDLLCSVQDNLLVLFLVQGHRLVHFATLLDKDRVNFQFDGLPLYDLFLDRVLSHKSINKDFLALAYSMSSVHCLKVDLRVKI